MENQYDNRITAIEEKLQTVYDPEFPLIDIFTLGLIYNVGIVDKHITITMSFTSPQCPMAETLKEMIKNGIYEILPDHTIELDITFDPMRTIEMIKDEDLKKMFE